ncbi:MAG: hypothetical protein Q4Q37_10120 [Methanobrevibacter sp.]|nr:hypothetical protein [Methanobrevibacter sp.]
MYKNILGGHSKLGIHFDYNVPENSKRYCRIFIIGYNIFTNTGSVKSLKELHN